MREIKFRARNTINGNWVYGYFFNHYGVYKIHSAHTIYPVHLKTVGEFTGLKDKNGIEIYEGDILKAIDILLTVYYNDATASFDVLHYGDKTGDTESLYSNVEARIPLEIIGNIYENPELLTA